LPRKDRMLRQLARRIDAFQERVGRFTSFVTLAMVLVVFVDVVLRYGLSKSSVFMQEMEWHLFAVGYLFAAGYTMLYDEHVRVDIVYSSWSPRRKAWANFVFAFLFFFPSVVLVIYTSIPFVRNSFMINEGSPDPGGVPARWVLKSVIIIGFVLLGLQGISETVKNYYIARGWEEPNPRPKEIH
jgi:TRAP-type mannitol/chloroaromatic compound transport system permease small subunit